MTKRKSGKKTQTSGQPRLIRSIVLVGLMGAGKTSVGARLASALGVGMVDSDDEIQKAANMTIAEIFETRGEAEFRGGERRVLARLMTGTPRVIATGGGAFMDDDTRALVKKQAVSVWLKADLEVLVARTAGRTHRPLLNKGNPRQILAGLIDTRYPIYAEADVVVESMLGQTHEAMSEKIIQGLRQNGRAFAAEDA